MLMFGLPQNIRTLQPFRPRGTLNPKIRHVFVFLSSIVTLLEHYNETDVYWISSAISTVKCVCMYLIRITVRLFMIFHNGHFDTGTLNKFTIFALRIVRAPDKITFVRACLVFAICEGS